MKFQQIHTQQQQMYIEQIVRKHFRLYCVICVYVVRSIVFLKCKALIAHDNWVGHFRRCPNICDFARQIWNGI